MKITYNEKTEMYCAAKGKGWGEVWANGYTKNEAVSRLEKKLCGSTNYEFPKER